MLFTMSGTLPSLHKAGALVVTEPTFEAAQKELEEIVHRLESGEAPLDEALKLWQRGEELYRLCRKRLDAAEGQIEELASRAEASKPA